MIKSKYWGFSCGATISIWPRPPHFWGF